MKRGPAASPSSQIVTRRTLLDFGAWPWLREATMVFATGTTEMQVKVL